MITPTQAVLLNIKLRAEAIGFKMSDICREAEIDPAQASRWISGKTIPLITSVRKLEDALVILTHARKQHLGVNTDD
jgi:transcriptional regulator with XRE-family HTH domain